MNLNRMKLQIHILMAVCFLVRILLTKLTN